MIKLICILPLIVLAACDDEKKEPSVWENYDVRQPLPYNSGVPDSQVNQINRYDPYRYPTIDNDEYYIPPQHRPGYNPNDLLD